MIQSERAREAYKQGELEREEQGLISGLCDPDLSRRQTLGSWATQVPLALSGIAKLLFSSYSYHCLVLRTFDKLMDMKWCLFFLFKSYFLVMADPNAGLELMTWDQESHVSPTEPAGHSIMMSCFNVFPWLLMRLNIFFLVFIGLLVFLFCELLSAFVCFSLGLLVFLLLNFGGYWCSGNWLLVKSIRYLPSVLVYGIFWCTKVIFNEA